MRTVVALRLLLPAVWLGLVLGLSFIETPLKFLAPGITVPLGLGIGRLVFWALAIAGAVLLAAMTVVSVLRPRSDRGAWWLLAGLWATLAVQSLVVRPALSARSDVVIAGGDPGPSALHFVYIATDLVIVALLLVWIVRAVRRVLPPAS
jgi:hypothetical protein